MTNSKSLKTDLANCFISFDRRTLVTDLLEQYELSLKEIHEILLDYLHGEEKRNQVKYNKRFILYGEEKLPVKRIQKDGDIDVDEDEDGNKDKSKDTVRKIYTIVPEKDLQARSKTLQNTYSILYSVERLGGAKPPADIFKPIKMANDVKMREDRQMKQIADNKTNKENQHLPLARDDTNNLEKKPEKIEDNKDKIGKKDVSKSMPSPSASSKNASKSGPINKMFQSTSPAAKGDVKGSKMETVKGTQSKLNFTSPNATKKSKGRMSENSSMEESASDAFKKPQPTSSKKVKESAQKSKKSNKEKKSLNRSISIFGSDEDDTSSNDEEKMEAIRREVLNNEPQIESTDTINSMTRKRSRRILDSDSDDDDDDDDEKAKRKPEEPPAKQEKLVTEKEPTTFLDDDGFLVTTKIKSSSNHKFEESIKTSSATAAPVTSMKESTATVAAVLQPIKKKQAGIMNYFSKK